MSEKCCKVYVEVEAEFSEDGRLTPRSLRWTDGRRYEIDRVKDCVRAASRKAGGAGICYTVEIGGRESHLYYEENYRWFVEARSSSR